MSVRLNCIVSALKREENEKYIALFNFYMLNNLYHCNT